MTRTITARLVFNTPHRIFWLEVSLIALLFVAYVYFISASIVNVVLRQEATVEIATIHSRISELEADYFSRKQSVDAQFATEEGFTALSATHYITSSGGKLSKN